MIDNLALYARYMGISMRAQMQYRASFVLLTIGHLFATVVEFLGIWVLFQRFGSLRGWTLPQVALFYGVVNVAFAIADGFVRGFDLFGNLVKSGDFDRILLRPRSPALQVAGQEIVLFRVGRIMQGGAVLAWASAHLGIAWTLPKAVLLVAMVGGGSCLFYGLFVLQATMAFWTVETLEIMNAVTYGGSETAQFPMPIYRPWFRRFFTYVVPLACMNYIPARALLDQASGWSAVAAWAAPLGAVAFLLVSLRLWGYGVRHYCSTGS